MTRCLVRAGVLVMKAEQPYLDVATPDDGLASLAAETVRYRIDVRPLSSQRRCAFECRRLSRIVAAEARRTHRELRWGEL